MMKTALLAASALLANTFVASPGFAAVTILGTVTPADADTATLALMQDQCDAKAAAHGTAWTGTVDESSISSSHVSGPTEVGTHSIGDAIGDPVGAGTFTPAHLEILGDPFRNGGSVNMFGIQQSVGGRYSASQYDFEGDFTSTYSYSFNCNMAETVQVPADGHYVIDVDFNGNEEQGQQSCEAFNALGPTWEHWGADHAQCDWVETQAAHTEDQPRDDEAGTPVEQSQTDTLLAHEDAGEGFDTSETLLIGQVVVCISPSTVTKKLPGAWRQQNGYTGDKCTTAWYDTGATVGVPNLNTGSHNWVTVPIS